MMSAGAPSVVRLAQDERGWELNQHPLVLCLSKDASPELSSEEGFR